MGGVRLRKNKWIKSSKKLISNSFRANARLLNPSSPKYPSLTVESSSERGIFM